MINSERTLVHWLGLLGIVSFLSYAAAVIFAPLAYPNYDWRSQAVSDLMAAYAPSLLLWNQLSSLYGAAGITCIMMVCITVQNKLNNLLRMGIYLFAAMFWISIVGFTMFPLSGSETSGAAFQDIMHIAITVIVVLLSIVSLILIMIGGFRNKNFVSLATWAAIAFMLMLVGAIGTGLAPSEYFGIFQRFSNLISANGFLAILGIYLFLGKFDVPVTGGKV